MGHSGPCWYLGCWAFIRGFNKAVLSLWFDFNLRNVPFSAVPVVHFPLAVHLAD